MNTQANELMTPEQLNELRAGYDGINTIDPCGDAYPKLIALLNGSGQERLKQLAGAGIKFVSKLAANRVTAPQYDTYGWSTRKTRTGFEWYVTGFKFGVGTNILKQGCEPTRARAAAQAKSAVLPYRRAAK